MRSSLVNLTLVAGLLLLSAPLRAAADGGGRDLREQYGTRSLEAARHLQRAIELSGANQPAEADAAVDAALNADPSFHLAAYWKALLLKDLGDIDASVEQYKKCIEMGAATPGAGITVNAQIDLGLTMGMLERYDESNYWLSRAVVENPDDPGGAADRAKAYKNMMVTLHQQGQFLSGALAAEMARAQDPQRVGEEVVLDLLNKAGDAEAARALALDQDLPQTPARTAETKLEPVEGAETLIPELVTRLLPDPQGTYVVALVANAKHYYRVTLGDKPKAQKLDLPAPAQTGCLAGGKLYLLAADQGKLLEVDPASGNVVKQYDLGGRSPKSVAVFPSRAVAFFPWKDTVHRLDLAAGGRITDMKVPGQVVAGHPNEQYLFSRSKDEHAGGIRHIIVDGRPIFIQPERFDWNQTTLFKYYVTPARLVTAEVRGNAAANGYDVVVSPDGKWVSVPGGGGWRPEGAAVLPDGQPAKGGYCVAVFPAANMTKVQAVLHTDAYPQNVAYNPVTNQAAAVRGQDAKVYHLASADAPAATLAGSFSGVCAWTGDGRHLLLGHPEKGFQIYRNTLSDEEVQFAKTWTKAVEPKPAAGATAAVVAAAKPAMEPVAGLDAFTPTKDADAVKKALADAIAGGRTDRPAPWQDYGPYTADADAAEQLRAALAFATDDVGVRIYRLNTAAKKHPGSVPLKFHLAEALRAGGQSAKAEARYLEVIRADAGRTELSRLSLNGLGTMLATRRGREVEAAHCLAASLSLDRANPETVALLSPLLEKTGFTNQRKALLESSPALPAASTGGAKLPALPAPPGAAEKLAADALYEQAVPSVVLIRTRDGTGTGVCVAEAGLILTSHHVIRGAAGGGAVEVFPFEVRDGKARKLDGAVARILAVSEADDLAVLAVAKSPPSLRPLAVASQSPRPGERVFSIGNPGLGAEVLELSMSEGIVSSSDRTVDGKKYVQHTAAVNPGNSGGPLLNERGEVVGVVSVKAFLENVSFATPPEAVRALFVRHGEAAGKGANAK